jgi:hypothetical protein
MPPFQRSASLHVGEFGADPVCMLDELLSSSAVAILRIPHGGEYLVAPFEQAPCGKVPEAGAGSSNEDGFWLGQFRGFHRLVWFQVLELDRSVQPFGSVGLVDGKRMLLRSGRQGFCDVIDREPQWLDFPGDDGFE